MISYIQAISEAYPGFKVNSNGSPFDFDSLNWDLNGGQIAPTKAELDTYILQSTKNSMWLKIQEERSRRQYGGVYIASVDRWFHSDATSRIQQLGLVIMGANLPTGIMWKTMSGAFVEMTPTLALAIFNAVATLDMQAFGVAEQHKGNMMAAQDPSAYDFSAGWPAVYGA